MSENQPDSKDNGDQEHIPRFIVTQEEYDNLPSEEKAKFNYKIVDADKKLSPPETFSIPEEEEGDE